MTTRSQLTSQRGGPEPRRMPLGSALTLQRMRLESVHDDHLEATILDVDGADVDLVLVAKPPLLRRTPFDGETRDGVTYTYTGAQTRSATDGSETQSELIIPKYVAGDEIVAALGISGGTGVRAAPSGGGDERAVRWLDVNADGRAWARAAT